MADRPKTGKRVQIYLPGDLLERWEATPRYERSATVAAALRDYWKESKRGKSGPIDSQHDSLPKGDDTH